MDVHALFDLPVHVQPGLHDDVVAVALGYGRIAAGTVGDQVGQNGFVLAEATGGRLGLSGIPVRVAPAGRIAPLACVQGHQYTEGRPIVYETTLSEYQRDPKAGNEGAEHTYLHVDPPPVPGAQWGMRSTSLLHRLRRCMVACQMGTTCPPSKSQVLPAARCTDPHRPLLLGPARIRRRSPACSASTAKRPVRDRLPRAGHGAFERGLNLQVYNRCVGTVLLQQLSYKVAVQLVRHTTSPTAPAGAESDVTVRTRGYGEAPSACSASATRRSGRRRWAFRCGRGRGHRVPADLPHHAITFGDQNDTKVRVAAQAKDERAYTSSPS